MKIRIVAIGDELLNGQVINTNASWIADEMTKRGYNISEMEVIPDDRHRIVKMLDDSFSNYDLTFVTGGLGPTKDDLTKKVFAEYFHCGYKIDERTLKNVRQLFQRKGLEILKSNEQQAEVPEVCEVLENKQGTAPGMVFQKNGKLVISTPGVPFETKGILSESGFAYIERFFEEIPTEYYSETFLVVGIAESFLAERIADWENRLRADGLELAYLPALFQIKMRLTTHKKSPKTIQLIHDYIEEFKKLESDHYLGAENCTLSGEVGKLLKEKHLTVAAMESCTAGGVMNELVKTSGSSVYVKGGLVTYTNEMKIKLGNIDSEIIEKYTELSEECARAMAENVANLFQSAVGIGITGMLENVENQPTFAYIAIRFEGKTTVIYRKFGNNRLQNIQLAIFEALNFLRKTIR